MKGDAAEGIVKVAGAGILAVIIGALRACAQSPEAIVRGVTQVVEHDGAGAAAHILENASARNLAEAAGKTFLHDAENAGKTTLKETLPRAAGEDAQQVLRSTGAVSDAVEQAGKTAEDTGESAGKQEASKGYRPVREDGHPGWESKSPPLPHLSQQVSLLPGEQIHTEDLGVHYSIPKSGSERIEEVPVFSAVPEDESEFQQVYGREATMNDEKEILAVRKKREVFASHLQSIEDFRTVIESAKPRVLLFVAHSSDKGGMIHFAVGTITLEDLQKDCLAAGKLCLVLTCFSRDLKLTDQITARQAMEVSRRASEWVSAHPTESVDNLIHYMRAERQSLAERKRIVIAWAGGTAIGGAAILYESVAGSPGASGVQLP